MKKVFIVFFILCAFVNIPCLAQIEENKVDWGVHSMDYSDVGTAGWQFLKLPTNARTASMGGINSSISLGNANAALTNPASTANVNNLDIAFTNMNWVADIHFQTLSIVKNFDKWGTFGINAIYVDYGEEIRTEYTQVTTPTQIIFTPALDQGTVGASDLAAGLSYARSITDKLKVGGNIRYLQEKIDDALLSTWSLDIGTMFYTGFKTLRISMLGRSFGPDAEFHEYKDRIEKVPFRVKMPMSLSIGAAMDLFQETPDMPHRLIAAAEYLVPNDGPKKLHMGLEYTLKDLLALRAGYKFNYDVEGLTLGGGVNYKMQSMSIHIDYAYLDAGLFNQVHMFTIGIHKASKK